MKRKPKFPPLVKGSKIIKLSTDEILIKNDPGFMMREFCFSFTNKVKLAMVCSLAAAEWEDAYWAYNDERCPVAYNNQHAWHAFRREHCK